MIKKSILVLDDMLPILVMFKDGIPKEYDVVIAFNVQQAKILCTSVQFDFVITDINIRPDDPEGGIELIRHLIDINFLGKVGIMSGYSYELPDELKDRVNFVLIKPFVVPEFIKILKKYD